MSNSQDPPRRRRPSLPLRRPIGPYPFLSAPSPLAFAHRGGAQTEDENSLSAFGRAVDIGYRYMETDVHVSSDGVPVLFHDDTLERMTGDPRPIASFSSAQLEQLRVRGEPLVPRLTDALAAWPEVKWNLDIKADGAVAPTWRAIVAASAIDRVLVASFSDRRLAQIRSLAGPRLATSMGQGEVARLWMSSKLARGWWGFVPNVPAAQVPIVAHGQRVVTPRFIDWAHRLGVAVHVWTVNDPSIMRTLLDMGVDGIMTDNIEQLATVYQSRGLWPNDA